MNVFGSSYQLVNKLDQVDGKRKNCLLKIRFKFSQFKKFMSNNINNRTLHYIISIITYKHIQYTVIQNWANTYLGIQVLGFFTYSRKLIYCIQNYQNHLTLCSILFLFSDQRFFFPKSMWYMEVYAFLALHQCERDYSIFPTQSTAPTSTPERSHLQVRAAAYRDPKRTSIYMVIW